MCPCSAWIDWTERAAQTCPFGRSRGRKCDFHLHSRAQGPRRQTPKGRSLPARGEALPTSRGAYNARRTYGAQCSVRGATPRHFAFSRSVRSSDLSRCRFAGIGTAGSPPTSSILVTRTGRAKWQIWCAVPLLRQRSISQPSFWVQDSQNARDYPCRMSFLSF